jgi:predicted membrane protein
MIEKNCNDLEVAMRRRLTNYMWGIFFIVIGIGYTGNVLFHWRFDLFFNGWWTFFIIVPCLISALQNGFGLGNVLGLVIGILLFLSETLNLHFDVWELIIPAICIFMGLKIMMQGAFQRRITGGEIISENGSDGQNGQTTDSYNKEYQDGYCAVFSSNRVHIDDASFRGTSLNAIFGGVVLDLRDIVIQEDVQIDAAAIFGGIDIFVPAGVRVKVNSVPIFGGVSNKTAQNFDAGAPTVYIHATCMFGGVDIK